MTFNPDPKPEYKKKGTQSMSSKEYRQKYVGKPKARKNKFNAVRQTYNGYSYDSKREANYAAELDWRIKSGEVKSWERQYKIECYVCGVKICNYYMDFKVYMSDGTEEYHEVKGAETPEWRLKWKLSKALYPDWKFVLIK